MNMGVLTCIIVVVLVKFYPKLIKILFCSGTVTPALTPRGDSLAVPPVMNGLPEEGLMSNGISRSATASPTPQISQPASWTSCCRMIYIKTNMEKDSLPTGYWPIPETFWPDLSMSKLVSINQASINEIHHHQLHQSSSPPTSSSPMSPSSSSPSTSTTTSSSPTSSPMSPSTTSSSSS